MLRVLLILLGVCPMAWAGIIQVAPVQVSFAPTKTIETVYITNHDKFSMVVQLDVKKWNKELIWKNAEESTDDLLATPTLFQLAPGQTQLVRIALIKDRKSLPSSYRLWVREVMDQSQKSDAEQGIKFVLQLLVPINIEPPLTGA